MKLKAMLAALAAASMLVACGGGGADAGSSPFDPGSGGSDGGSSGGTVTDQALALNVQLLNGSSQPTTSFSAGETLRVKAVLTQNGTALKDQLVQFALEQQGEYAVLDQLTTLTDSNGVAIANLSAGAENGAGRVKVVAKLENGTEVTGGANFIASGNGAPPTTNLTLSEFDVDTSTVSAYGTTGFSVKVFNNGAAYTTPVTVSFSSDCPVAKATITSSAQTRPDGVAVGTFEDKGCAATVARPVVLLTASIGTDTAQKQFKEGLHNHR